MRDREREGGGIESMREGEDDSRMERRRGMVGESWTPKEKLR